MRHKRLQPSSQRNFGWGNFPDRRCVRIAAAARAAAAAAAARDQRRRGAARATSAGARVTSAPTLPVLQRHPQYPRRRSRRRGGARQFNLPCR